MSDWFDQSENGSVVDVEAFFDSSVPGLLAEVVSLGVLISVWTTRDGGAVGISVTSDGRNRKNYFRESGDAADWLLGARTAISGQNGHGERRTAPPVSRKRTRGPQKAV